VNFFETQLSAALEKAQVKTENRPTVYLAAVSGGADSAAMLAGLAALQRGTASGPAAASRGERGFILHCVHVEHGIRPAEESRGDALAVEDLCKRLEVPCRVISIPPGRIAAKAGKGGPGIEAAARFFRYKALRREMRRLKADWILTGHTRDDLLETILMRVLRGSGPAGLAPMPRTRGHLLRPLLDLTRQDLLDYLSARGIPYRTDATNTDIVFLRNRIRHKLIPVLDEFFPSWRSSLLAMAETQALAAEFIASEVSRRLPWEEAAARPGGEMSLRLREADFLAAPLILREEAVFAGADKLRARSGRENLNSPVPRRSALRRAVGLGATEDLGPLRLEKRKGSVYLTPKKQPGEKGFSALIKEAGLYTLKTEVWGRGKPALSVRVFSAAEALPKCQTLEQQSLKKAAFYARLPVVFRNHKTGDLILRGRHRRRLSDILDIDAYSGYTGVITACDADGTAAFVGLGRDLLVINRDNAGCSNNSDNGVSFFELKMIFEGKNV
jgi:tRNA(Ile)-lysidine synthase